MNTPFRTTADDDMLNNAQFEPVFDQNGNLVDIIHVEINTDRSRGIRAMEELAASTAPGDELVYADGWTGKWKRVLNTPAPGAAHTIKRTKRWNSQEGAFQPSTTLFIPFEVVWALFNRLFFGRYSIEIKEITCDTEDVMDCSSEHAHNLPGRIFYARAQVAITLYLENGQTRTFTGFGVSYDSVKGDMTGNPHILNSIRRMAEKGAVSDAKREALASMGRVFNRAFEDGAQALHDIETKLLERMQKHNKPRPARAVVPAPRRNTNTNRPEQKQVQGDTTPENSIPMGKNKEHMPNDDHVPNAVDMVQPQTTEPDTTKTTTTAGTGYVGIINAKHIPFNNAKELFDAVFEAMESIGNTKAARELLEANRATLLRAERDKEAEGMTYAELEEMLETENQEPTVSNHEPENEDYNADILEANRITPQKETGEEILKAYKNAFKQPNANIDAILMANTNWAKRLTKLQALELAKMAIAAKSKR